LFQYYLNLGHEFEDSNRWFYRNNMKEELFEDAASFDSWIEGAVRIRRKGFLRDANTTRSKGKQGEIFTTSNLKHIHILIITIEEEQFQKLTREEQPL